MRLDWQKSPRYDDALRRSNVVAMVPSTGFWIRCIVNPIRTGYQWCYGPAIVSPDGHWKCLWVSLDNRLIVRSDSPIPDVSDAIQSLEQHLERSLRLLADGQPCCFDAWREILWCRLNG